MDAPLAHGFEFHNATGLDTPRLRTLCRDAIRPWRTGHLRVFVRYSRGADYSGTCYTGEGRILVNLGRHLTLPLPHEHAPGPVRHARRPLVETDLHPRTGGCLSSRAGRVPARVLPPARAPGPAQPAAEGVHVRPVRGRGSWSTSTGRPCGTGRATSCRAPCGTFRTSRGSFARCCGRPRPAPRPPGPSALPTTGFKTVPPPGNCCCLSCSPNYDTRPRSGILARTQKLERIHAWQRQRSIRFPRAGCWSAANGPNPRQLASGR